MWALTDPAEDYSKETIYTIALRVRKALIKIRDPGYAAAYVAANARKSQEAIDAELAQDFIPRPGYMAVNSTWRCVPFGCRDVVVCQSVPSMHSFDWTSAHFGYPGQTRFFHTLLDEPRYVKIFQPNPMKLSDGSWRTRTGDAEISFYLHKVVKDAFVDIFKAETRALEVSGEIEFV
jgi:hypothetical protein